MKGPPLPRIRQFNRNARFPATPLGARRGLASYFIQAAETLTLPRDADPDPHGCDVDDKETDRRVTKSDIKPRFLTAHIGVVASLLGTFRSTINPSLN
jgi:hypothetical protein